MTFMSVMTVCKLLTATAASAPTNMVFGQWKETVETRGNACECEEIMRNSRQTVTRAQNQTTDAEVYNTMSFLC